MFFKGLITSMAVLLTIGRSYTGEWEGRFLFLTSLSLRLIFISLILYKITIIIILIVIIISFLILCCHFVILFSLLCLTSFAVCLLFYYYYYFFCIRFSLFTLIFLSPSLVRHSSSPKLNVREVQWEHHCSPSFLWLCYWIRKYLSLGNINVLSQNTVVPHMATINIVKRLEILEKEILATLWELFVRPSTHHTLHLICCQQTLSSQ